MRHDLPFAMPCVADDETVHVHALPPIIALHKGYSPTSMRMRAADVTAAGSGTPSDRTVVTPVRPIKGCERRLNAEQMLDWVQRAEQMAKAEGGSGLLIGYDPLRPDERRAPGDIVTTYDIVSDWGRAPGAPPLFAWDEVAAFYANRESPTAEIYLTDGRAIFLHADVDWDNRLS